MAADNLTPERLREFLHYDPETGVFVRKAKVWRKGRIGAVVGWKSLGYLNVTIEGRSYPLHRLAWLYMTGEWPAGDIDHRDGDRANNRWENLRDVSRVINAQNIRAPHANNISGMLGAHKHGGRWSSVIRVHGKRVRLGEFATPEEAHAAYLAAKRQLHEGCEI